MIRLTTGSGRRLQREWSVPWACSIFEPDDVIKEADDPVAAILERHPPVEEPEWF